MSMTNVICHSILLCHHDWVMEIIILERWCFECKSSSLSFWDNLNYLVAVGWIIWEMILEYVPMETLPGHDRLWYLSSWWWMVEKYVSTYYYSYQESMSVHTAVVITQWNERMLVTIGNDRLVTGNGKATTILHQNRKWVCYQRDSWSLTDGGK